MIWIILTALVVIFCVGYWFMTRDTRKANNSLACLLKIKPAYIDAMLLSMGHRQSQMFIRTISTGYADELRKAAYVLFIYQTFIMNSSEENILYWRNILLRAGLDAELKSEHAELTLFYFSELDLVAFELAQFRRDYNQTFNHLPQAS
jgi:uncharacterized protein YneF (UPF0154 family)